MKLDPSATDGTPGLAEQYKDERTEKKIQEHLNNENDIITEEDIANAPVGIVHHEQPIQIAEPAKEASGQEENQPKK